MIYIYLVGSFISYFMIRYSQKKRPHYKRGWYDIIVPFLLSWIVVIIWSIWYAIDEFKIRPPKWM